MTTIPSRAFLALFAATAFTLPISARAADTHDDARRRYQQGVSAFEKGDFTAAIDAFTAVYKSTGRANHLWNLALAEYKANHAYDALTHLREYVGKPDAIPSIVERAQGLIAEESTKIAHVTIVAPDGADVFVDGARIGAAPITNAVELDPDRPHVVLAKHGADEAAQTLAAPGAKDVPVRLAFPVSPPPPAPVVVASAPSPTSPPAGAASPSSRGSGGGSPLRTWLTVGLGVGAVAAGGVAVLMGVDSNNAANSASSTRNGLTTPNQCRTPGAPGCASLQSELSSQQSDHVTSMVLYGVAGALAAGAIATWLFVPHETGSPAPATAAVTPMFGSGFVGASCLGRF
jgi:hypothetical protein